MNKENIQFSLSVCCSGTTQVKFTYIRAELQSGIFRLLNNVIATQMSAPGRAFVSGFFGRRGTLGLRCCECCNEIANFQCSEMHFGNIPGGTYFHLFFYFIATHTHTRTHAQKQCKCNCGAFIRYIYPQRTKGAQTRHIATKYSEQHIR